MPEAGTSFRFLLELDEKFWNQIVESAPHNHRGIESRASELISFGRKNGQVPTLTGFFTEVEVSESVIDYEEKTRP